MDAATINLLIQGATALVSLGLGWFLRHLTVPGTTPAPIVTPVSPVVVSHPVLDAFGSALQQILHNAFGQVLAGGFSVPVVSQQTQVPAVKS